GRRDLHHGRRQPDPGWHRGGPQQPHGLRWRSGRPEPQLRQGDRLSTPADLPLRAPLRVLGPWEEPTMTYNVNSALVSCALLLGVLATTGCKQPDLNCTVYHGGFAAKYELTSGDAASACGSLPGDVLGLNAYYADAGERPDLEAGSMAIRPQYVNDLIFHALDQGVTDLTMEEGVQSVGDFDAA